MAERTVKGPDEMVDTMVIVLPCKMVYFLESHAKKLGITPSAVIHGALSVYKLNERAR